MPQRLIEVEVQRRFHDRLERDCGGRPRGFRCTRRLALDELVEREQARGTIRAKHVLAERAFRVASQVGEAGDAGRTRAEMARCLEQLHPRFPARSFQSVQVLEALGRHPRRGLRLVGLFDQGAQRNDPFIGDDLLRARDSGGEPLHAQSLRAKFVRLLLRVGLAQRLSERLDLPELLFGQCRQPLDVVLARLGRQRHREPSRLGGALREPGERGDVWTGSRLVARRPLLQFPADLRKPLQDVQAIRGVGEIALVVYVSAGAARVEDRQRGQLRWRRRAVRPRELSGRAVDQDVELRRGPLMERRMDVSVAADFFRSIASPARLLQDPRVARLADAVVAVDDGQAFGGQGYRLAGGQGVDASELLDGDELDGGRGRLRCRDLLRRQRAVCPLLRIGDALGRFEQGVDVLEIVLR